MTWPLRSPFSKLALTASTCVSTLSYEATKGTHPYVTTVYFNFWSSVP